MKRMVLGLMMCAMSLSCGVGKAEDNARTFANKMFGQSNVRGVSCMQGYSADSDGDGYVSCTVAFHGERRPEAIECATEHFGNCNTGCRMATGKGGIRR